MGASSFDETIYGVDDLNTAYRQLCDEARYEYGSDPYNGTIATTNGVELSPLSGQKPIREDRVDFRAVSERTNKLSKWEHCEAIRVEKVTPARNDYLGHTTLEVSVPSDTPESNLRDAIREAASKRLATIARAGDSLGFTHYGQKSVERIALKKGRTYTAATINSSTVLSKPKLTTKATKGKTETRYFIISESTFAIPLWEKGYRTQAEARAALPVNQDIHLGVRSQWEIISINRREGGAPLVSHEVDLRGSTKNTTYSVTVGVQELVAPAKGTGEYGWFFYGIAAE